MSRSVFYKRRIIQDSDDEFEVEINKKTKTLIETEHIEQVTEEEQTQSADQNENEEEQKDDADKATRQPETVSVVIAEEAEAYGISFEAIEGTDRYQ